MGLALEHIASLGAKYAEVAYIHGYMDPFEETAFTRTQAEALRRQLDETGLECHAFSSHLNLGTGGAVERFKRRTDFAAILGAKIVISNAAPRAAESDFLLNIFPIAAWAESCGLKIALENPGTGPEDLFDTGQAGAALIERLDIPNIGLNYDCGNLISHKRNRIRPEQDMLFALPQCLHVHIKDVAEAPRGWVHTEIGAGIIDYGRVLANLVSTETPVSLEIPLRLRRRPDGSADRLPRPVSLEAIDRALGDSLAYVEQALGGQVQTD